VHHDYREIPALAAYIDRIGAEQLNFKRFMVRTWFGAYYKERTVISLDTTTGKITCKDPEFKPSETEASAIKDAIQGANFPKPVEAPNLDTLFDQHPELRRATLYTFWNRETGLIKMVQERRMTDKGKAYIPWSGWSDGDWRPMEPEGDLPFWKPKTKRSNLIMVHEGAKVAAAIEDLIASGADHPWLGTLKMYEHWGLIGGALAPHRAAYSELRKADPGEVVYVCDNDLPGVRVLTTFSRCYGQKLYGVRFDQRWPLAWDLADEMPKGLFSDDGVYTGPELHKLFVPATWATKELPAEGRGRKLYKIADDFTQEWAYCIQPEVFVPTRFPDRMFTESEFNSMIASFSDVENTAKLMKKTFEGQGISLRYIPGLSPGLYAGDGDSSPAFINTHVASAVRPLEGDPSPFLEFMDHLIPQEKDRREMLRWCATLIARPEVKMSYGVLLVSEMQGVGKSTLGEKILGPIVGNGNKSTPGEWDVVESNYNYWLAHKRLIVMHEIYAGGSKKAYDRLKSIITDKFIMINKKYMASYEIENYAHVIASSNSMRALKLQNDDRRWFVPEVTEHKLPHSYWVEFNKWLSNGVGLRIIAHWAEEFLKENHAVIEGEPAPFSASKQRMIEESLSQGLVFVSDTLDGVKEEMNGNAVWFTDGQLAQLISSRLYEGRPYPVHERPAVLAALAKKRGWFVTKDRWLSRSVPSGRIISNSVELIKQDPTKLLKEGLTPYNFERF
jgi:hypothetical protein